MAGLLRRILNSGYAIVAVGAVGFLLVFSLQFVVETTRREAYTSLKTAQNAQATLNLLAKEIWRLRYWDNAPNPERGKIVEARGEILGRIASHRQALELYTKTLGEQDDYTNLSTQIDNYLVQSNETDRLWEEMGRWSNEFTSGALTSTIGPTEKALAATSHNSSIYVPLREAQLVQYQMLLAGQTRVRVLPDGENLAQIAGRVLKELPKAQFAPSLTADVRQAMESLARKDYIAQQLKLSAAIKTRNASIDALEGSLRGISLRLIKQQGAAGAGFEAARSQSLLVVSVGCIALGLLFVITSVTATRSMRRQAKLLQESERRFKDFASASSDTLVELDPDYNIIKTYHTNGAVDYDSERSVVGHPFFASRPDGKPSPLRVILDQRKSFRGYEAVLPSRTEKNRWRRVNGVPFYDENQKFAGFRLSVVNIAEQKALEEELQAKQALYEQLAEQVPGAVFVVRLGDDGKADLEYASPYFSNLTGYSTDEANELTRSGGTILSRDTLERSQEMRDKHPDGAVELKGTIKRKDGKIIPIIYSSRNIAPAPSGELRRLGMLIDLSELEAAEQAVQDRERQLTSILSNIGSAYFFSVTMGGGKIEPQFCSPGVETVLGYSPQEWCDLFKGGAASFALTAHPDDRKRIQAVFEQMALGDDPAQWEFQALNRRCRKDGRIINCMTRGRHIRLPDGRLLQEGMVIDVTLDLQRQEELIRLKTAVDAASESIAIWRKLDDVPGGQRELVYANKMAQQLLARTAPPAAADQWASVRKAPEPDLRLDDIDRAVDAKGRWSGLQQIMCNDGTSMLADITVTRIDGTTALHVVRDVTAIKLLETANEKARAELQDVVASLDFAGEGIVITHPLKEIVFANKSFAKWAAHGDPAEIIGKSMMDLLGETDPPLSQIAEEAAKVTARGEVFTTEATVTLRKNGSKRIMRWSTAPLSDGRWINISRDVTELRGLEFKRTRLDRSVAEIASRRDLGRMPPREIYEMILREISRTMDVRRASIWRMTTDNAALQSVLALHDGNIVAKFVTFERSTRELYFDELFKLRSIVINDVSAHPVTQSIHDGYYSRLGITSTLDVPILWQGALWG
ncbi:MAG: PAS domain S-box protein, partial [Rhodospirillaceae bacterium]|nr:PAS domain S-box protein [Rhodospirillaceae bacterium]